jgi:hypothetical protein
MYGAACRFLHHTPSSNDGSSSGSVLGSGVDTASPQKDQEQQQQEQGLTFDWSSSSAAGMPAAYEAELISSSSSSSSDNSDNSFILLLGEGDFSFTASLLKRRAAARPAAAAAGDALGRGIVASSYEQQQGLRRIYPGRALEARLQQLEAAGERHCLERPRQAASFALYEACRAASRPGRTPCCLCCCTEHAELLHACWARAIACEYCYMVWVQCS